MATVERTCNMTKVYEDKLQLCGKPARYAHPRYPIGLFCTECAMLLARALPDSEGPLVLLLGRKPPDPV